MIRWSALVPRLPPATLALPLRGKLRRKEGRGKRGGLQVFFYLHVERKIKVVQQEFK